MRERSHSGYLLSEDSRGKTTRLDCTRLFDLLHEQRDAIEAAFGGKLGWSRREGGKPCRIYTVVAGGKNDGSEWPPIVDEALSAMDRLYRACSPFVEEALEKLLWPS